MHEIISGTKSKKKKYEWKMNSRIKEGENEVQNKQRITKEDRIQE